MSNLNTAVYDSVIDRAAMSRLYEKRISDRVSVLLNKHQNTTAGLIANGKLTPTGTKVLKATLRDQITKTYREIHDLTKGSLLDFTRNQISFSVQNIEAKIGNLWKTQKPPRKIPEELVLKRPLYNDKTLSAGWAGVATSERKRLEGFIRKGMAEGKTVKEIAADVRKGSVHKISKNQANALVTTSMTSVYAQADQAVYKANEGALQGWQYVAVLDSRTTPLCAARDARVYEIGDTAHLPPAHWNCRSTTAPVFKAWNQLDTEENLVYIKKRNLEGLTPKQRKYYDDALPMRESYDQWLFRQPRDIQLKHLGSDSKVTAFNKGQIKLEKFTNPDGKSIGLRDLTRLTSQSYSVPGTTTKFSSAKDKLDSLNLGASRVEDFMSDKVLRKNLHDYYLLQAGELDGTLSLMNYRGVLIRSKAATKKRVLTSPPREDQTVFNAVTGRYEDARVYQPAPQVLNNNLKLVRESDVLTEADKDFILDFSSGLASKMGVNQRAAVVDNLRILVTRQRKDGQPWRNFKAVSNSQMKFDVMNASDAIETSIRAQTDPLKKLKISNYIDPVLGEVQLDDLAMNFVSNIKGKLKWEASDAPKLA